MKARICDWCGRGGRCRQNRDELPDGWTTATFGHYTAELCAVCWSQINDLRKHIESAKEKTA